MSQSEFFRITLILSDPKIKEKFKCHVSFIIILFN